MTKNDLAKGIAKSIRAGIEKYQSTIKKNIDTENEGLKKLEKTIGQVPADQSGAGTDVSAGGPMISVPNVQKKELKKEALPGSEAGGSATQSSMSSPLNSDGLNASEKEMNKDELVNKAITCPACGGPSQVLGSLDNLIHTICNTCHLPAAHQNDGSLVKKAGASNTIASTNPASLIRGKPATQIPGTKERQYSGASTVRGTPAINIPGTQANKWKTGREDAAKEKRLAANAPKLTHSPMPVSVGKTPPRIPGRTPPKLSVVDKILSRKELDKKEIEVGTVEIKAKEGSKLPPENPKEIKAEGSGGKIAKYKDLNKGAIADMVSQFRTRNGISKEIAKEMGLPKEMPPAAEKVDPPHNPGYKDESIKKDDSLKKDEEDIKGILHPVNSWTFKQSEIKEGSSPEFTVSPVDPTHGEPKKFNSSKEAHGFMKQKPYHTQLWKDNGNFKKMLYTRVPSGKYINNGTDEHYNFYNKSKNVEKGESLAAKPVMKSPSSAPAGKASASAPATMPATKPAL
jgi:hypothetical protein